MNRFFFSLFSIWFLWVCIENLFPNKNILEQWFILPNRTWKKESIIKMNHQIVHKLINNNGVSIWETFSLELFFNAHNYNWNANFIILNKKIIRTFILIIILLYHNGMKLEILLIFHSSVQIISGNFWSFLIIGHFTEKSFEITSISI